MNKSILFITLGRKNNLMFSQLIIMIVVAFTIASRYDQTDASVGLDADKNIELQLTTTIEN